MPPDMDPPATSPSGSPQGNRRFSKAEGVSGGQEKKLNLFICAMMLNAPSLSQPSPGRATWGEGWGHRLGTRSRTQELSPARG